MSKQTKSLELIGKDLINIVSFPQSILYLVSSVCSLGLSLFFGFLCPE